MLVLKSTTAMLNTFRSQAGPQMHDCSLLPCWVFSGRKLVLKSTTAILNTSHAGPQRQLLSIFPSHAGPQIHDSHAQYFPVACWSSTTAMLSIFPSHAGPQIHDSHAEYFPVASWSSNPRQPC